MKIQSKSIFSGFILFSTLAAAMPAASADELQWSGVRAFGGGDGKRCRFVEGDTVGNNVFWTSAGSSVAFVFTTFGIDLPRSRNPLSGRLSFSASCNIEARVTVPQGYYIATLAQTLTYGVLKDAGTTGGVTTGAFLFQNQVPLNQINLALPVDRALNEPLFTRTNNQIFDPNTVRAQCAASAAGPFTTPFKLQLLAAGARPAPFMNLIVNVDSADVEFELSPALRRCP